MGKTWRKGDKNFRFDDCRFEKERNVQKKKKEELKKEHSKRKRQIEVEDDD